MIKLEEIEELKVVEIISATVISEPPPRGFREQGNWNIYFLGTGDIFKLFSGNKGTLE